MNEFWSRQYQAPCELEEGIKLTLRAASKAMLRRAVMLLPVDDGIRIRSLAVLLLRFFATAFLQPSSDLGILRPLLVCGHTSTEFLVAMQRQLAQALCSGAMRNRLKPSSMTHV